MSKNNTTSYIHYFDIQLFQHVVCQLHNNIKSNPANYFLKKNKEQTKLISISEKGKATGIWKLH